MFVYKLSGCGFESRCSYIQLKYFKIHLFQLSAGDFRDFIGTKLIKNGKVKRNFINKVQGKCAPCLANNRTLCWEKVANTATFSSNQTIRTFQINHNLNCKNKYVMYLLECTKCKMQYLEKLKLSSILDLVTTERMYGNQMLYQQAIIFQAKTITSTYMRNN